MLRFDFESTCKTFINKNDFNKILEKKEDIKNDLYKNTMSGWLNIIDDKLIKKIIKTSEEVKKNSKCLVVIGIGGSFLGSFAINKALDPYFNNTNFQIIYTGTTLSSKYTKELLEYLKKIDFSVNVISKSGSTMEVDITYKLIKELMKKKYTKEEMKKRIIITTDEEKGPLRQEANQEGYTSFPIPSNIGGRYSILTAAHLFPLAFNYDIKKFKEGYKEGKKYIDKAYEYAAIRNLLYKKGKVIESIAVYEQNLYYFTEWLKQLLGETEGKNGKGVFPTSTVQTRDLHSLGQFIQDGTKILFETFIKVKISDPLMYKNKDLHEIGNTVLDSVRIAHFKGNVPSLMIEIEKIDEFNLGEIVIFYMLTAAFSAFLMEVDPFNQPGVEIYKKEIKENLRKF